MKKNSSHRRASAKRDPSPYPKGWSRKRVEALIDHYENQSDEEAIAEDNAAYENIRHTMMAVPVELVPKVQRMIAKKVG